MKDSATFECRDLEVNIDQVEKNSLSSFDIDEEKAANHQGVINCEVFSTIKDLEPEVWDSVVPSATGLKHSVLDVFESSEVNDLVCSYLLFKDEGDNAVAKSNLYQVDMDFTTLDKNLRPATRHLLKKWHPEFLDFSMIECGQFAMNGDGLVVTNNDIHGCVIDETAGVMQKIADDNNLDLLVMRDVPLEKFDLYNNVLSKRGFFPVSGFTNAVIDIEWDSLDEFLDVFNSKVRYKLRTALKIEEKYDVRVEITSDYERLSFQMAKLWKNVNCAATDYSREQLDEKFFKCAAQLACNDSEIIAFYYDNKLVAFMWNLIGDDDYHMADWGVDYDFPRYNEANFYRVASVLSLERAITLGKKRMQLGITNYTPKKLLSAKLQPLIYFIKHRENNEFSRTVSRMMTDAIDQPEPLNYVNHTNRWSELCNTADKYRGQLRRMQSDYQENDCLYPVESSYDISLLQLGGIYSFYPQLDDSTELIQLSGNNCIEIMRSEEVVKNIVTDISLIDIQSQASAFFSGIGVDEEKLAELLSVTLSQESVQICGNGYMAHLAALSVLAHENVIVYMDQHNSPPLWDAVKLGGAEVIAYSHLDYENLRVLLEENKAKPALIVSEAIFSIHGDQADIQTLCDIRNISGSRLYIDESNSYGFIGSRGEGLCVSLGQENNVDIIAGSFNPIFGLEGGFIAGASRVIDYIKHASSPLLFSNRVSRMVILAATAAITLRQEDQDSVAELVDSSHYVASHLEDLGYSVVFNQYPIITLLLGDAMLALSVQKHCLNQGLVVTALIPPIVPECASGIRLSLNGALTLDDKQKIISVFSNIKRDMDESRSLSN